MDTESENGSSILPPKHLKTISGLEVFVFCLWIKNLFLIFWSWLSLQPRSFIDLTFMVVSYTFPSKVSSSVISQITCMLTVNGYGKNCIRGVIKKFEDWTRKKKINISEDSKNHLDIDTNLYRKKNH